MRGDVVVSPYAEVKDAHGKILGWIKYDEREHKPWIAFGAYGRIGEYDTKSEAERVHHMNDLRMAGTV
jgi:hypothetical protein